MKHSIFRISLAAILMLAGAGIGGLAALSKSAMTRTLTSNNVDKSAVVQVCTPQSLNPSSLDGELPGGG